jgi:tellurite resistance protein
MLLAARLSGYAPAAGQTLVVVFLTATLILGGLLTGEWIVARLDHDAAHPVYFLPTLAIEVAPPAVAGIGYFALTGGRIDLPAQVLAGYLVLMIVVQIRLLPQFLALRFGPGFWAFTFSWAAAATDALEWITLRKPAGATVCAVVILAVITAFVGYVAARTVLVIARGQLLPPRAQPGKVNTRVIPNETVASGSSALTP